MMLLLHFVYKSCEILILTKTKHIGIIRKISKNIDEQLFLALKINNKSYQCNLRPNKK